MPVYLTALGTETLKLACSRIWCIDSDYSFCVLKTLCWSSTGIYISSMSVCFSHYICEILQKVQCCRDSSLELLPWILDILANHFYSKEKLHLITLANVVSGPCHIILCSRGSNEREHPTVASSRASLGSYLIPPSPNFLIYKLVNCNFVVRVPRVNSLKFYFVLGHSIDH